MSDYDKRDGDITGWIFPIIMTALFWPVGIFMLLNQYKKTRRHSRRRNNYASLMVAGALMAAVGLIGMERGGGLANAVLMPGGVCLALCAFFENRRCARLRTYQSIIGDRPLVDVAELAGASGNSEAQVLRDLERMLNRGMLPERAYVDRAMNCLVLDPKEMRRRPRPQSARAKYAAPVVEAEVVEESPRGKAEPQQAKEQQKPKESDRAEILRETFDAKIREIRYLNEQIDDAAVSAKIDEIESVTANIFYLVQEKPERMEEIRTFMNYYLPTTFKLLNAYARLERQHASGTNIDQSRREIEGILDKLVEGFRQQLDRLFQSDAIDISSDIEVLETMMARDGLLGDGLKPKE